MAEGSNTSGGGAGMAFILGALVVVVALIAFLVFTGGLTQKKRVDVDITASAPQIQAPAPAQAPTPAPAKPAG